MTPESDESHYSNKVPIMAFISSAIWIILITILGFLYPGYNHLSYTISVLSERYAPYPYAFFQVVNFIQFGLMIVLVAIELNRRLDPSSRLGKILLVIVGFSIMMSGPFSGHYYGVEDFPTILHIIFGIPVFLLGYFTPLLFARKMVQTDEWRQIGLVSYAISLLMFIQIVLFMSIGEIMMGFYQRIYVGLMIIWILIISYKLINQKQ